MRFGLRAAIVLSASAGVSASAITCSVGQLFMRRRSPARTTTSSSTSKTPVCETEVEVAIVVLCVSKIVRDGILSDRIFQRRVPNFQNAPRRGENALPPFQAHFLLSRNPAKRYVAVRRSCHMILIPDIVRCAYFERPEALPVPEGFLKDE